MAGVIGSAVSQLAGEATKVNPVGLVSTITQDAAEATLVLADPALAPFAISMIAATVDGVLTNIPVVGGTLSDGVGSAIATITQVLGPGETAIIPIIGSVTAVVGSITEIIPVVAPTGSVSVITSEVGSIVGSVTGIVLGGQITTGLSMPVNTGAVTVPTSGLGTGLATGVKTTGVQSTPGLPTFSSAAIAMLAPNSRVGALIAVFLTVFLCMFSGGAMIAMM